MKAYLEPTELERLEEVATCLRDRLLMRVLRKLGCRISEALALRVEDIDFTAGTLTILHLKSRIRFNCPRCGARLGKKHKFCPGCGSEVDKVVNREEMHQRMRTLPIDSDTLEMAADFIRRDKTRGLIFRISRHRAWQLVRDCAARAGLPSLINPETGKIHGISPHCFRNAFVVHAMKSNGSADGIRMLQVHLGHASFNSTARYRKVASEELKQWYAHLWEEKNGD